MRTQVQGGLARIGQHSDVLIVVAVILIVVMMVLPLPPAVARPLARPQHQPLPVGLPPDDEHPGGAAVCDLSLTLPDHHSLSLGA